MKFVIKFLTYFSFQNNIIGSFLKLEQLIITNTAFANEDFVIAAIPSADQLSLLINASSGLLEISSANSRQKKASVASIESEKIVEEPETVNLPEKTEFIEKNAVNNEAESIPEFSAIETQVISP